MPSPRPGSYLGMPYIPSVLGATWAEDEAVCYPGGAMKRRAFVRLPDGTLGVVRCGLADTMFTLPARHPKLGAGFVSVKNEEFHFTPTKKE